MRDPASRHPSSSSMKPAAHGTLGQLQLTDIGLGECHGACQADRLSAVAHAHSGCDPADSRAAAVASTRPLPQSPRRTGPPPITEHSSARPQLTRRRWPRRRHASAQPIRPPSNTGPAAVEAQRNPAPAADGDLAIGVEVGRDARLERFEHVRRHRAPASKSLPRSRPRREGSRRALAASGSSPALSPRSAEAPVRAIGRERRPAARRRCR